MYLPVRVQGLFIDPISERPILVLRHEGDQRVLPIWIGPNEAHAIAMRLEGVEAPRPMTHDLLRGIVTQLGAEVQKVLISDLRDNTYFAQIVLRTGKVEITVDARPSDAVALAVRTGAPILVREDIFDPVGRGEDARDGEETLRAWLEGLGPEELGRYEM
jgi:hypothetical protein